MSKNYSSVLATLAVLGLTGAAQAQSTLTENTLNTTLPGEDVPDYGFTSGSLIAVPIPFSNPTLGTGLVLGAGWLFTADEGSQSSSIGIGALKSDNGSEGYAFGSKLNLQDNRYILSFVAGAVDLNYDFTAGPIDIPLEQSGDLINLELAYGFTPELSLGVSLGYAETTISTSFGGILPPELVAATDLEVVKFGLISEWDTRDSDIYPTSGALVTFDVFQGEVSGDASGDYHKGVLYGSYFEPGWGADSVFALSGTLCRASSSAPFFDACSIGLSDGLRGFSATQYIGESLVSAQVEYRGRFGSSRFGYAAFAGAGVVNGTTTSQSGLHAAVGAGLRYRVSQSFPVDFAVDATYNSDEEQLLYIYVGQSF